MAPLFNNLTIFDDDNAIGIANGRESVRDNECRSVFENLFDGILNAFFGLGIDRRSRLIENEESGVGNDGAGKTNQLFLTR